MERLKLRKDSRRAIQLLRAVLDAHGALGESVEHARSLPQQHEACHSSLPQRSFHSYFMQMATRRSRLTQPKTFLMSRRNKYTGRPVLSLNSAVSEGAHVGTLSKQYSVDGAKRSFQALGINASHYHGIWFGPCPDSTKLLLTMQSPD
jgi:hypothetical protein